MTTFERIVESGCWDAWMRGTRGTGLEDLARTCPDLWEAFEALSRGDVGAFITEARRAVSESGDSAEETAFFACRGALEGTAEESGEGRPYGGGLGVVADALFPGEAGFMLGRCVEDLASVLRIGSPVELVQDGDVLLEIFAESLERARDAETAGRMSGALETGARTLVSRCSGMEGAPGYAAAMERVSMIGLFGRMLARSLDPAGPPPDPDSVRALSACIPRRWEDGTAAILSELYACMCSLSGRTPAGGVTREDLAVSFVDMTGCPDPSGGVQYH